MHSPQITSNRIKELSKNHGISISKLLSDCGLNKNAIFTMQSSGYFPRIEAIIKIADYLDCSVDYLLGRTDNPQSHKNIQQRPFTSVRPARIAAQGHETMGTDE